MTRLVFIVTLLLTLLPQAALSQTPTIPAVIVAQFPHDPLAFTQGLIWHDGRFIESTGHFGSSTVRRVRPETGRPDALHVLHEKEFAEGIALAEGIVHLVTWRSGNGYLLDTSTLNVVGRFTIPSRGPDDHEAWGLAYDGKRLIMSDGTARLTFLKPLEFKPTGHRNVHDDGQPVEMLNELEYVNGRVLANVWKTERIAVIDPETGRVDAWIDLSPLRSYLDEQAGVANGIAWDSKRQRLFVTGKDWDKLFEIAAPGLDLARPPQ